MRKAILPILLLFIFSLGFSDAISDFVNRNLNFVVSAFIFLLVFGISVGAAGMWVDDKAQLIIISLGISALISILVLLNPNLSDMLYSIITYSPIFLIAFILIALVLIIFIAKEPWQKGLAAAILIAAVFGILVITGGISGITTGSGPDLGAGSTSPLLFLSLIALIGLVIGIGVITKKLKTGSVFGGGSDKESSKELAKKLKQGAVTVKTNQSTTKIFGRIVEYNRKGNKWQSANESLITSKLTYKIMMTCQGIAGSFDLGSTNNKGEYDFTLSDKINNNKVNLGGTLVNTWTNLTDISIYFEKGGEKFYQTGEKFNLNEGDHKEVDIAYLPNIGAIIKGQVVEYEGDSKRNIVQRTSGWKIKLLCTDNEGEVIDSDKVKNEEVSESFFNGYFVMLLPENMKYPLNYSIIYAEKEGKEFYMTDDKGKNPKGANEPFKIEKNKRYEGIEVPIDFSFNILNVKINNGAIPLVGAKITLVDTTPQHNPIDSLGSWGSKKSIVYGICNFKIPKDKKGTNITLKIENNNSIKYKDGLRVN